MISEFRRSDDLLKAYRNVFGKCDACGSWLDGCECGPLDEVAVDIRLPLRLVRSLESHAARTGTTLAEAVSALLEARDGA